MQMHGGRYQNVYLRLNWALKCHPPSPADEEKEYYDHPMDLERSLR